MAGCLPCQPVQVPLKHVTAHLSGHPAGLQQGMHAQPVQGGQEPFRLHHQVLLRLILREQGGNHGPNDHGDMAVAPVGFRGKERPDPRRVLEGQPGAGLHSCFLIQGKHAAQQGQDGLPLFRAGLGSAPHRRQQGLEPANHAVHHSAERERQEFLAAFEVVPDGTNREPGLVRHFPQRGALQPVDGDDTENSLDYILAPGISVYYFGHHSY
jgi:hypothetical protein